MAEIGQRLEQKMLQKLSPQQIQLMKLLQIPSYALDQRIQEELESNPALEKAENEINDGEDNLDVQEDFELDDYIEDYIDEDPTSYSKNASSLDEFDKRKIISDIRSLRDHLDQQLSMLSLSEEEKMIANQIVGSLDEDGYLRRDTLAIVDDLMFSQNVMVSETEVEKLIQKIQKFDPPGLAARNLKECLLIQMNNDKEWNKKFLDADIQLAKKIISDHFDAFSKKHYKKLIKYLEITEDQLKKAIDTIISLNPKPASAFKSSGSSGMYVIPDFIVENREGQLFLSLNSLNAPELHVNSQYQNMLSTYKEYQDSDKKVQRKQKEAAVFIKQKVDAAKWFIDAIRQRQQTLYKTMYALLQFQEEYFLTGDESKIKPMILKDIADITGLDVSTVSRVASSKYVQTEFGTKKLKEFFSESMQNVKGEEISTLKIKKALENIISNENKKKPFSDIKLKKALEEVGYKVARRTISKYREQLGIPVARLRKEL